MFEESRGTAPPMDGPGQEEEEADDRRDRVRAEGDDLSQRSTERPDFPRNRVASQS